jgi:hypothetical protein
MEKFTKIIVVGTLLLGFLTAMIAYGTIIGVWERISTDDNVVFIGIILVGMIIFRKRDSKWISWFIKKVLNFDSFSA